MAEYEHKLKSRISALVSNNRKRFIVNSLLSFLPLALLSAYLINFGLINFFSDAFNAYITQSYFVLVSVLLIIKTILIKRSKSYRQLNLTQYLFHLNNQFKTLEHSAQLIEKLPESLPLLQQLQRSKAIEKLSKIITIKNGQQNTQHKSSLLLPIKLQTPLILSTLILLASYYFSPQIISLAGDNNLMPIRTNQVPLENINHNEIDGIQITIKPPIYTAQDDVMTNDLDLSFVAGSRVTWQLTLTHNTDKLILQFSNGEQLNFNQVSEVTWQIQTVINQTGIYKIVNSNKTIEQVHTLTAIKDQKPQVRIIKPKARISELKANTDSAKVIELKAYVSDDFKLSKVDILASVAKGSGEAVKFRDQVFEFDSRSVLETNTNTQTNDKTGQAYTYHKSWSLTELAMEPGDELYFTVRAYDNRDPETQLTRSITKIIRWLDDDEKLVMSDGVLIDFMPEYFKSQRQIIIETKQLIEDKDYLAADKFVESSELLGVAQSQLKEKYGQYLGDETDDGGHVSVNLSQSHAHENEHDSEHQDEHKSEQEKHIAEKLQQMAKAETHGGDDHGNAGQVNITKSDSDKSGYQQTLATYAHNHEDVDIGVMGRRDPKALMKRSLSNMWQAELHLMLSQPELALPFEEQALKYLKLAKKADRIYVKRLGFEPPPVTDQRRYQGEMDEILTDNQVSQMILPASDNEKLAQLYQWLNEEQVIGHKPVLSKRDQQFLNDTLLILNKLVEKRPSLVSLIAIVEKIKLENSTSLPQCDNCLIKLKNKIWQVLPFPVVKPASQTLPYSQNDPLYNGYLKRQKQLSGVIQ